MFPSPVRIAALLLPALPLVVGCQGETDANGAGAAYPESVGADMPEQTAAASELPPAPAPGATAEGQVQGQGAEVAIGADSNSYSDTDPDALSDFRPTLDPYGTWVEDPNYGTVWVPSASVVGDDFAPYVTAGHWAYDDDDYVWVSDYEWGWAPFHYGRWVYIGGTGWGWIPGRTYAGAWVTWRDGYYDGYYYCGWAPLPPTWYWYGGYAVGIAVVPPAPYVFVRGGDLFSPVVAGHVVAGSQVGVVASHTRNYVPATPGVGGHTPANPSIAGPPPSQLHIPPSAIAHTPTNNTGLLRARQFSRPSTAMAAGARPPTHFVGGAANARAFGGDSRMSSLGGASRVQGGAVTGGYGAYHSLPGGAVTGHALLPHSNLPAYNSYGANRGSYAIGNHSAYSYGSAPAYHGYAGGGSTFRGGSSFGSGSSFGGGSAFHGGGVSSGGYHAPPSTFYGGGGYTAPSGGSHFGGGGGGHFGGGGGHFGGGGHGGGHR